MKLNDKIINSDIVIFLGAGASAPFGKLLMNTFMAHILEKPLEYEQRELLNFLCAKKGRDLEEVLEDVKLFIDKDYYLKTPEKGNMRNFGHNFREMREIAIKLDRIIRKTLIEHYRVVDNIKLVFEKYNPLFELIKKEQQISTLNTPIFTTNYDNIIEELCYGQEDKYNLVDGTIFARKYSGKVLDFREFEKFKSIQNAINIVLFKLHGSICWELDSTREIIRMNPQPMFDDHDPIVEKIYIAPTKAKIAMEYPYVFLYEYLQRCLDRAKICICIGYSFRDYDSLTKFKSALDFNQKLKLIILNDKAEKLKNELFENYKQKVIPVPYYFGSDDEKKYLEIIGREINRLRQMEEVKTAAVAE